MRRPGFQDGTMVPPQKPEQKTPFIDKLKNLRNVAPGLMPRSKVDILKMYMDEALKDGEITQDQYTEMLMPYFGELGEKVTEQIEVSDRENFAIGGGQFEGTDLGTREGFNNVSKSEASFKAYEDKFGKELLDKAAQDKYGKNFRELDKTNELKFFKSQVNKYEDFIKENKRYPTTSEAYSIGLKQSGKRTSPFTEDVKTKIKNIYTSGEGGSTYISKKLAEEGVNIDDSTIRRFITAEEEAGNIVRPTKFKTQEAKAPKDRYNIVREVTDRDLKGFKVGSNQTEVLAPKGSKYKVTFNIPGSPETTKIPSAYQGTKYYKTKSQADNAVAGYNKFSKNLAKQRKANRSPRAIILDQVSDRNIEADIGRLKTFEDLATAHRVSYKQVGKLNELYNVLNLGVEDPTINSGAVRKFENKLDRLYEEQRNLLKTAKRSTNKGLEIPKNIQDKIDFNNKKISAVVDLTDNRIQGILVNAKDLKPYVYGVDYLKTYGMGMLKSKNVKDLTDQDLATIELNLKNQIDQERKVAGKDFDLLKNRQKFLKNVDELASPGGAKVAQNLGLLKFSDGPKLQARIPGLSDLLEMAKDIPGDIKKAKFISAGLKTLGLAATPIVAYDTYKAFEQGKPAFEALERGLIGTNLIGSTKDLMALSPEGREARSVVKQGEIREQIADDFSGLDTDFDTPNLKSEMSRQEAEQKYQREKIRIRKENAARDKAIANARAISIEGLKNLITGERFAGQQIPEQFLAVGGRVGYADGPDDPSKRKFIKLGAGLMSLPIIGKYLKFAAPVAEKTTEIIRRGADGIPDFILDLIAKVKLKAEEKGMKYFTGNRSDEFADVYQADDFVVTEQGNKITLKKRKQEGDMLEKDIEMEIETDPETGGITYKEATARPDAEGKLKDVEEYIDEIDLEDMKKYTYDE